MSDTVSFLCQKCHSGEWHGGQRDQLRGRCITPGRITQRDVGGLKQGGGSGKREACNDFSVI